MSLKILKCKYVVYTDIIKITIYILKYYKTVLTPKY